MFAVLDWLRINIKFMINFVYKQSNCMRYLLKQALYVDIEKQMRYETGTEKGISLIMCCKCSYTFYNAELY